MDKPKARLFGPGFAATGEPVVCDFNQNTIGLYTNDLSAERILTLDLAVNHLEAEQRGFDEAGIALNWQDARGRWAIHFLEAAEVKKAPCDTAGNPSRSGQ